MMVINTAMICGPKLIEHGPYTGPGTSLATCWGVGIFAKLKIKCSGNSVSGFFL